MVKITTETHSGHEQTFEFENETAMFWHVWNECDTQGDLYKYYDESSDSYNLNQSAFDKALEILVHDFKSFEVIK